MKLAGILMLGTGLLLCAGCGGDAATHDSLTRDMIACMNEQADLLATITNEVAATAALPKLEELVKKNTELKLQCDKFDMPDPDTQDELRKKYEPELMKVRDRINAEMDRIKGLEEYTKILAALQEKVFNKLRQK